MDRNHIVISARDRSLRNNFMPSQILIVEDIDNLASQVASANKVFVAEEHSTRGGVATTVADTMVDQNIADVELIRIGFPADEYSEIAAPFYLYRHYGLDADGLVSRISSEYK